MMSLGYLTFLFYKLLLFGITNFSFGTTKFHVAAKAVDRDFLRYQLPFQSFVFTCVCTASSAWVPIPGLWDFKNYVWEQFSGGAFLSTLLRRASPAHSRGPSCSLTGPRDKQHSAENWDTQLCLRHWKSNKTRGNKVPVPNPPHWCSIFCWSPKNVCSPTGRLLFGSSKSCTKTSGTRVMPCEIVRSRAITTFALLWNIFPCYVILSD